MMPRFVTQKQRVLFCFFNATQRQFTNVTNRTFWRRVAYSLPLIRENGLAIEGMWLIAYHVFEKVAEGY